MLAIDTNIVVRYLTGDHPEQSPRARELIDGQPVFVPVTVALETEWVLRSAYQFKPLEITKALRGFGGLPTVTFEDAGMILVALERVEQGMDFADSLHLARSTQCDGFRSFDRKLIAEAYAAGLKNVSEP